MRTPSFRVFLILFLAARGTHAPRFWFLVRRRRKRKSGRGAGKHCCDFLYRTSALELGLLDCCTLWDTGGTPGVHLSNFLFLVVIEEKILRQRTHNGIQRTSVSPRAIDQQNQRKFQARTSSVESSSRQQVSRQTCACLSALRGCVSLVALPCFRQSHPSGVLGLFFLDASRLIYPVTFASPNPQSSANELLTCLGIAGPRAVSCEVLAPCVVCC